ncbi:MAG: hypothetical protein M1826_004924 [Phylliscum demangeonii]|nr:MAG: hypothetical protein M1826_004924 [Phylliscum demangeonii]
MSHLPSAEEPIVADRVSQVCDDAVVPVPRLNSKPFDALGLPAINPYWEEYYLPTTGKTFPRSLTVEGQSLRAASMHVNTQRPTGHLTTGIAYT